MEINGTMCDEGKERVRERIKNLWKKIMMKAMAM